ncbi:MAG: hypothetical protein E7409_01885 [Ruminococcaceae bacterium]|nr:hypothetical protein [Oscillospiraceae bacterium]
MVNLIVGEKGTGKTKAMIDAVNKAVDDEHGNVVFIGYGSRHMFDLNHGARLVDASAMGISGYEMFEGFIQGVISQNYDITHIFIDSLFKIFDGELAELPAFINKIKEISAANNIKFTITISAAKDALPGEVSEYIA